MRSTLVAATRLFALSPLALAVSSLATASDTMVQLPEQRIEARRILSTTLADLGLEAPGRTSGRGRWLILPFVLWNLCFVIAPLLEIAPDCRIPGRGLASAWLPAVSMQAIGKLPNPLPSTLQNVSTGPNEDN